MMLKAAQDGTLEAVLKEKKAPKDGGDKAVAPLGLFKHSKRTWDTNKRRDFHGGSAKTAGSSGCALFYRSKGSWARRQPGSGVWISKTWQFSLANSSRVQRLLAGPWDK